MGFLFKIMGLNFEIRNQKNSQLNMRTTYCTIIHKKRWFPVPFYQFKTNFVTSYAIN